MNLSLFLFPFLASPQSNPSSLPSSFVSVPFSSAFCLSIQFIFDLWNSMYQFLPLSLCLSLYEHLSLPLFFMLILFFFSYTLSFFVTHLSPYLHWKFGVSLKLSWQSRILLLAFGKFLNSRSNPLTRNINVVLILLVTLFTRSKTPVVGS